ncbi:MAG: DUF167 domain-containing protein [Patescibacteria group bacterium]
MKITISVKPNSGKSEIQENGDNSLVARLKSAPVDGKANEELVRLLSKHFHVPQKSIVIKQGSSGKKKLVEILGIDS